MNSRWLLCLVFIAYAGVPLRAAEPKRKLTYEQDIRPLLKAQCFQCHGEEASIKGKLDLRLVRFMMKGGVSGEAIVPFDHEESLVWQRVFDDEMPPIDKKLTAEQKQLIATWIDQGAETARPEPETLAAGLEPTDEEKSFWSFQPIRRVDPPKVAAADRVRTPIDAFLLGKLESKGVGFSPDADRLTLIRRVAFTLTGLPPTPAEVETFLKDESANAYELMVERYLNAPQYGERWARHWLDVAGYADSDGYTVKDAVRPYAYKYRDYLIRSLNQDRPWDELIREQLAGDEMVKPPYGDLPPADIDKLIATGFLRMGPDGTSDPSAEAKLAQNDTIVETIKIVSTSMLGLTIGCAQCHAHRYDPISHEDYFQFRALFEPAYNPAKWRTPNARLVSLWTQLDREKAGEVDREIQKINKDRASEVQKLMEATLEKELESAPKELHASLRKIFETPAKRRTAEQLKLLKSYPRVNITPGNVYLYDRKAFPALTKRFDDLVAKARAKRPPEDFVHALTEIPGEVPVTKLFYRGDIQQPRQAIEPGEVAVLTAAAGKPKIPVDDPDVPTTGRRLAYAKHLTSGKHPLVARVLVNRVWLNHFGQGIVNTPGDFGKLGEAPSHPDLLDWLADEFMSQGWSLKRLHRLILTSTAFRQSSQRDPKVEAIDPDNRLLGRMSIRRVEAESVRDAILSASGKLTPTLYGPPVPVAPDEGGQIILGVDNRDGAGRPTGKRGQLGDAEWRRALYIQVRRTFPLDLLESFDAPLMSPNCERRTSSTVAPQSLIMMNNDFVVDQSDVLADRLMREAGNDPADQVRLAWKLALARDPQPEQVSSALRFLKEQEADFTQQAADAKANPPASTKRKGPAVKRDPTRQALASFCHVLFSSNAFLYVD